MRKQALKKKLSHGSITPPPPQTPNNLTRVDTTKGVKIVNAKFGNIASEFIDYLMLLNRSL